MNKNIVQICHVGYLLRGFIGLECFLPHLGGIFGPFGGILANLGGIFSVFLAIFRLPLTWNKSMNWDGLLGYSIFCTTWGLFCFESLSAVLTDQQSDIYIGTLIVTKYGVWTIPCNSVDGMHIPSADLDGCNSFMRALIKLSYEFSIAQMLYRRVPIQIKKSNDVLSLFQKKIQMSSW